ncbi:hypothetical protein LINGRAHAP2_LOCUS14887 [Linum grandiflorum]
MKGSRTKKLAMRMIHGEDAAQFSKLFSYKAELERTNQGSTVVSDYDGFTFTKMYICLDALKKGSGYRNFVCVDGCFLKGIRGWQFLSVVGVDGDDRMDPIAWTIIERECQESWGWFMKLLASDLQINQSKGWTFMSDRQNTCVNLRPFSLTS